MGTVAKSSITLVSISDAYSLSLTPNSCVIKADFDGSNPKLEHAYTIISAYCGDEKTPIEIDSSTIVKSNDNIEYQLIKVDSYRYRLSIISLPIDILQGYIEIPVLSGVSAGLTGRFTFSIVRESTMLDWIQDWESNKTTIGSSYVITPKLFVGKKIIGSYDSLEDVPGLTGVYIGPSENNGAGIYGYKDNKEIFHIDQTGGKIGGWDITSGGIQCEDGTLSIKSEGTISAQSEGIIHWLLNKDGSASFANGNVTMDVEGNALFKGTIETSGGSIAGWTIAMSGLFDEHKWDIEDIFNWACENTVKIAKGAEARYEIERNFMPQYDMADNEKSKYANRHEMFLDLLEDGFNKLVPKDKEDIYRKQLDHEIYVLESTNNVDYMLVQYDTVNWARKNGILVGCGRGSAGGCLVLYLLGITLIDPIKYDLLFERFLLPERAGLYPSDVTIIGDDVDSNQYIEVTLENHKTYKIDKDAQLLVKRAGMDDPIVVYADELQTDDDIQFDNRDLLFTLNEI